MFGPRLDLFSARGIQVRADASWLVIVALVTWSFWGRFTILYDRPGDTALLMAIAASLAFFGSVILHELAHALEAQRRGVHVSAITLFVFGGATETRFDVRRPIDEFALTAVGPATSLLLAASFAAGTAGANAAGWGAVAELTGNLAWLNLALGLFNLLPGAPLDGGRLLRAAAWKATGDRRRAKLVAASSGRLIGGLLIALGVVQILLTAALLGGLWLSLIGWFLYAAASAERAAAEVEEQLRGRSARLFVGRGLEAIPSGTSLDAAIEDWIVTSADDAFLVVGPDSSPVGVLEADRVRSVPVRWRDQTTVDAVATPLGQLPRIDVEERADVVVDRVQEDGPVLIASDGRLLGVATRQRVADAVRRVGALSAPARRGEAPDARTRPGYRDELAGGTGADEG